MFVRKLVSPMTVVAVMLSMCGTASFAQESQTDQAVQPRSGMQQGDMKAMQKGQQRMHRMHRMHMQGHHMMPATVTSVDRKTGKMAVNSEGMDLMVHFPPASLADVNKGDKITLMLGFRKGDVAAMRKERMMKRKSMMDKSAMKDKAKDSSGN